MSEGQREEDRLTSPQLHFSPVADVLNTDFKGSVSPENEVQSLPGDWAQYFHGYTGAGTLSCFWLTILALSDGTTCMNVWAWGLPSKSL